MKHWSPTDTPIQSEHAKRANSSIMECEEFILSDWSPPDIPIKSERANSWIMESEEFILPDWSPFDDPARVLAAKGRRNPSDWKMSWNSILFQNFISFFKLDIKGRPT